MAKFSKADAESGFTLVELSIVLVIIGLLVGGVLTGQSLIHASELRSVTNDVTRYMTSVHTFHDKYFALPGDMSNATDFWGIAGGSTGSDSDCYTVASTDIKTCNGNNDGLISGTVEPFRFWQHLANAGLIEGKFNGLLDATSYYTNANAPQSKFANAFFATYTRNNGQTLSSGSEFSSIYKNVLAFGTSVAGILLGPALKPEDAWNIDTKMDDGLPASGSILAFKKTSSVTSGCTTTDTEADAKYALTTYSVKCSLVFRTDF